MKIGSFAGGLADGFMKTTKAFSEIDKNKFDNETRDRQRREWEDQDAVRKAMQGATESDVAAASTGQSAAPVSAAAESPTAKTEPVQPSAVEARDIDTGAQLPGSVPGAGLASATPQPSETSQSSATAAQATAAQAPAAGQGLAATQASPQARGRSILKSLEAAQAEAAKRGNMDLFANYFDKSTKIRTHLRETALDNADRQFALSNDFNVYLQPYNEFVSDGNSINRITKNEDGSYVLSAKGADGKTIDRPVKDEVEMAKLINTMRDPKAMRALEAQRASKLIDFQQDIAKAGFKAEAEAAATAKYREPKVVTAKGADGEPERVGLVSAGGIKWEDGGEASGPKPLGHKVTTEIRSALNSLYKISDMDSMTPGIRDTLGKATVYASQLIQSNKGAESGARLDVNTAAKIASDMADGKLKEQNFTDKSGQTWRGVEVGGVKYLLDPVPMSVNATTTAVPQQSAAPAAGGRSASGKITPMQVDPGVQADRDKAAGKLIVGEYDSVESARGALASLDKELSNKKLEGSQRKILETERNKLVAGLDAVGAKTAPAAALAYLKANPTAKADFNAKYGYLPEGY